MKLKEYLKHYKPCIITKFSGWLQNYALFGKKTNNELLVSYNELIETEMNDLLIQNINYCYFVREELIKRKLLKRRS